MNVNFTDWGALEHQISWLVLVCNKQKRLLIINKDFRGLKLFDMLALVNVQFENSWLVSMQ